MNHKNASRHSFYFFMVCCYETNSVDGIIYVFVTNKNIKMSSFKGSENIQKKEGGSDRSVLDNQSSSATLNELAMKARKILSFRVSARESYIE